MDHVRLRTPGWRMRCAALLAAGAAAAALLAAGPAVADPADAAPGVPVQVFPFAASYDVFGTAVGGPGSGAANSAVEAACNGGDPIWAPQWFQLPHADTGALQLQVRAVNYSRATSVIPSGAAVVRTRTGTVLSCGGGVVTPTAAGDQLSVVAWFGGAVDIEGCDPLELDCNSNRLQLSLDPTGGGAPSNDAVANAKQIPAVPFEDTVDTTLATTDGPRIIDYDYCLLSSIEPTEQRTVYWRYTPQTTTEIFPTATSSVDTPVWAGVAEVTPSGPVRAPRRDEDTDPWDCDSPVVAQAGHTYLVGVVVPYDDYGDVNLPSGGTVDLRIGDVRSPGQPAFVGASVDGAARTATITWQSPRYPGGGVTGYRVWRDGDDSGGTGPWSTTLAASARSFTFSYLEPWDPYRLSVQAIGAGAGTPVTRVVATQGPAASRVTALVARPAGPRRVTVSWQPPEHAGSASITAYRIRRFDGTGWRARASVTVPATARSYTFGGLDARPYSYEVVAVTHFGAGRWVRSAAVGAR